MIIPISFHFTHLYDKLYKIVVVFTSILVASIFTYFLANNQSDSTAGRVIFIVGSIGIMYLIVSTTSWLPTLLYIRLKLHTKVSIFEAKRLSFLLDGTLGGKWFTLRWILDVNPEYRRREALFEFASKIAEVESKVANERVKIKCHTLWQFRCLQIENDYWLLVSSL